MGINVGGELLAREIAKAVAERCHGDRKPGAVPARYAVVYQAARLGVIELLKREGRYDEQ